MSQLQLPKPYAASALAWPALENSGLPRTVGAAKGAVTRRQQAKDPYRTPSRLAQARREQGWPYDGDDHGAKPPRRADCQGQGIHQDGGLAHVGEGVMTLA